MVFTLYTCIHCNRSAKVLFAVYVTFFFKRPLFAFYTRLLCMSYIFTPLYIIINVCEHKYNFWAFGVCIVGYRFIRKHLYVIV